jgi:signal transduction histidine kinase
MVNEFDNFGGRRKNNFVVFADEGMILHADPHLLRRVLFNLLDNAYRFAPEQTQIEVRAELDPLGRHCHISISDLGPGVPDALKEQIFDRLFLVAGSGHSQRGKGLGLAFCKLVAERHGGRIRVEDNHPQGSRFILECPLAAQAEIGTL